MTAHGGDYLTPSQMTLAIEAALRECEKRGFLTLLRPSLTIDAACYLRDHFGRTEADDAR